MDADVPDETIPPETNEPAAEGNPAATQSTDRILESETTVSYSYIYADGQLQQEMVTTDGTTETHNFFYDNSGKPYAMQVNGTTYYYVTNLQGDVMGMVDSAGNTVASYTYDPYGKPLTATGALAERNPLRYRGYYYDKESGFYYLQSRYYDPATRRFVNADDATMIGVNSNFASFNLYAYCGNRPILRSDENGQFWNTILGTISGAIVGGVTAALSGTNVTAGILSGALSGAISGAAVDIAIATCGTGLIALAAVAGASGLGGAAGSYVSQRMNGKSHNDVNWGDVVMDGVWGAIGGALSYGVADVGGKTCSTFAENMALQGAEFAEQVGTDVATNIVIGFGTWLNGSKMRMLGEGKATMVMLY